MSMSEVKTPNGTPKTFKSFDDILREIGQFGPYQKKVYTLLCLPSLLISGLLVFQVFLLAVPEHRCKIPGLKNDTFEVQSEAHQALIDAWIPPDTTGDHTYEECYHYVLGDGGNSTGTQECTEWVFDMSNFKNTLATQLNLVCDDSIKIPNAQMTFFFGVLSGSLFYGQLSDIIGRRKTLYLTILVQFGSAMGFLGISNYVVLLVLMFLLGGSLLGVYMTSYVIGMELVGPSKRLWTGNVVALFLTTGQLYMVLMVYLVPEWKYFTLALVAPTGLFLPYYWLIPESCRWLLSKGRKQEAYTVLDKIAKSNKKVVTMETINKLPKPEKQGRFWQLFTTNRTLTLWTILLFYNWFVCSFSYYGVVLNTGNLGGDLLFNFALMVVVEYPGKLLDIALMDRIGRKRLYVAYMIIGGLANIATIGPIVKHDDRLHYVLIGLAMVGKLCITGAFGAVYVHSAEIYPTVVRNAGMGASSAVARIGSMIAPYVAKSADLVEGDVGKSIPLTLFGTVMFISGVLTMFILPETLGKELPETINDIHHLKRRTPLEETTVETPVDFKGFDSKT